MMKTNTEEGDILIHGKKGTPSAPVGRERGTAGLMMMIDTKKEEILTQEIMIVKEPQLALVGIGITGDLIDFQVVLSYEMIGMRLSVIWIREGVVGQFC